MTRIQLRHDTATNWTTANPILAEGEVGIETDTNKMKIGDGVTNWSSLDYLGGDIDLSNYYTKTETNSLLAKKEDVITPIAPLNKEDVNIKSTATSTADDGETFTTPNTTEYPYKFDNAGTGLANFQVQTTASGNGIIDRTKNIVCDIKPNENIEYVWSCGTSPLINSPIFPMFVLGNLDSNGYFTPVVVSNSNFSWTNPYNMYFYVRNIVVNSIGASDTYDWQVGTKYTGNYGDIGYVSIPGISSVPTAKESKLRCYKNSNGNLVLYFQVTDSDNNTGSGTFTTGLDFDEVNINCILFHSSSTSTYTGNQFGVFDITSGEQIWNPAENNFQNQLSLSIGDGLLVDNDILKTNSYSKSEADELLEEKADDFVVASPLKLETPTTSTLSFNTYDKGEVNYNYETGEYYYGFASDRTVFQIIIDIPEDINIDVYSDYWRIGDSSLSFSRTQPNSTANNAIFEIYADNGTENVTVSRLWYGSSHYRAGDSTSAITYPFRDKLIAKHTANSTNVSSGGGGNLASGYNSNIVSGNRLSRIVLYCMCQCTGSWGTDFSSASWGNYWSDSSGAKLKSLKLYTSDSDTEGIELIRYSVNKPTMGLKIDNSLAVDTNGLLGINTNGYYNQTQIDTMLDNKADLDLANTTVKLSDGFLSKLMPDYANGISINSATGTEFTAPSSGWILMCKTQTTTLNNAIFSIKINGVSVLSAVVFEPSGSMNAIRTIAPVGKGDIITVVENTTNQSELYFYPAKGAN